ncbi:hypothetical protein JRQ81_013034 [Phrynocephalus forsythii]|uniref:Uncharacterized protein n=1 Tax=Phrynocephalus forsythii TaxID=171643 RepID=A0A9Q0XZ38_9SAUR|nr:hypothetical protein JRQ81_013034 [Phrynocephalus forsythii]
MRSPACPAPPIRAEEVGAEAWPSRSPGWVWRGTSSLPCWKEAGGGGGGGIRVPLRQEPGRDAVRRRGRGCSARRRRPPGLPPERRRRRRRRRERAAGTPGMARPCRRIGTCRRSGKRTRWRTSCGASSAPSRRSPAASGGPKSRGGPVAPPPRTAPSFAAPLPRTACSQITTTP